MTRRVTRVAVGALIDGMLIGVIAGERQRLARLPVHLPFDAVAGLIAGVFGAVGGSGGWVRRKANNIFHFIMEQADVAAYVFDGAIVEGQLDGIDRFRIQILIAGIDRIIDAIKLDKGWRAEGAAIEQLAGQGMGWLA